MRLNTSYDDLHEYIEALVSQARLRLNGQKVTQAPELPEGITVEGSIPDELLPFISPRTFTGREGTLKRMPVTEALLHASQESEDVLNGRMEVSKSLRALMNKALSGKQSPEQSDGTEAESGFVEFRLDEKPEPAQVWMLLAEGRSDKR